MKLELDKFYLNECCYSLSYYEGDKEFQCVKGEPMAGWYNWLIITPEEYRSAKIAYQKNSSIALFDKSDIS